MSAMKIETVQAGQGARNFGAIGTRERKE